MYQIVTTAVLNAVASILLKKASLHSEILGHYCLVGGGLLIYGISFLCYFLALQKYDVALAYTCITGLSIVFLSLASWWILGESFPVAKLLGMAFVFLGISLTAVFG